MTTWHEYVREHGTVLPWPYRICNRGPVSACQGCATRTGGPGRIAASDYKIGPLEASPKREFPEEPHDSLEISVTAEQA